MRRSVESAVTSTSGASPRLCSHSWIVASTSSEGADWGSGSSSKRANAAPRRPADSSASLSDQAPDVEPDDAALEHQQPSS